VTLVFLHPVGLDAATWQFMDDDLLAKAVLVDLLWHGGRAEPPAPLTLASMAEDVLASVPGPLDLVGVSMGGAVALEAALQQPERVRSMLLACSSAGGTSGAVQNARADAIDRDGIDAIIPKTLTRWFTHVAMSTPEHPGVRYARDRLQRDPSEAFAAGWRALANNSSIDRLHTLHMPSTVLHAEQDESTAYEPKQQMAARLQTSRLQVIAGPHMVQLEEPASFSRAVVEHRAWVDSVLG
jgi:3-oxoadipate enol-lactonase